MADSKSTMARLARVERDSTELKRMLGQIARILTDQRERIDGLGDKLGERLDRLIAVTMQERTYSFERLADIERRLTRLEDRT